jgi:hypothetical protein
MLPEEVISMVVAVGTRNVEAAGALSGLNKGARMYSKVMISEVNNSGWLFDSENQLWFGPRDIKNPQEPNEM